MRRRALLLTLFALLLAAPAAQAGARMEVGVQDDQLFVNGLHGNLPLGLKLTRGVGGTWIRANVLWTYVVDPDKRRRTAPKNLRYNWTGYDNLVEGARQRGIRVQLALTGPAPAWATSDHRVGVQKVDARDFADFARAAAEHFRGRVSRYTIWNEPNYVSWLAPLRSGARLYRQMYSRGYRAIKAADPDAKVLIGETAPYFLPGRATAPLKFLRDVTCANARYRRARGCSRLETDGFAHHPYDFRHAPAFRYPGADNVTLGTLGRLTSALTKLKKARLLTTPTGGTPFVYLTEYGYFGSGKYGLPASLRAKYLVRGFDIAQRNRRVKQLVQFLLVKPGRNHSFFDTSIATARGKPTSVYRALARWAKKAARAGRIAAPVDPATIAARTTVRAAASGPRFTPRAHGDRADPRKSALDLRAAAFGQVGTQLSLTLRTERPWVAKGPGDESLCVTLAGERPVGRLCVTASRSGKPIVRFRGDGGRLVTVRGAHARRSGRTIRASVYPRSLGLQPGSFTWFVRSRSRDRLPDAGALPLSVSAYGAPRCFGAEARAGDAPCDNPALRRFVTPAPSDAELMPDSPCARTSDARRYAPAVPCLFGARFAAGPPRLALIGDSHAMSLRATADVAAQALGLKSVALAQAGCGFATETDPGWPAVSEHCRRYVAQVLRWLNAHPSVHTVIVTASAIHGYSEQGLRDIWARIPDSVRRIHVVRDVPRTSFRTADCVMALRRRHAVSEGGCAVPRDDQSLPPDPAAGAATGAGPRVNLIDLTRLFCDSSQCFPVVGGAYVYRDTNHMNAVFGATVGPYLLDGMTSAPETEG